MKRDCPKRKNDLRDVKPSVVEVTEGSNQFDGVDAFLPTTESPEKSYWILDSSCLSHMCSISEHFDTYQRCEKDIVNMAKGTRGRVVGIGTVQIRIFDG